MRKKRARLPLTVHTAEIEKLSHDGRGIARIEGKTTFITNALAGEIVSFQYTRIKKDFDEGKLISYTSPAKVRVEPRCAHYEMCGGCSLQHLDEKAQIDVKQAWLLELFAKLGGIQPREILSPITGLVWHYRNKARLSVRHVLKKQTVLVGFREKNNPRFITEINECLVLNKQVNDYIPALRSLIHSFDSPEIIAQVEVAAGDDDIALIFRNLFALSLADQHKLKQFGQTSGFSLYLQPGGADTVALFYPENGKTFLHYTLPEENITYQFKPTDFTQINAAINQKMVAKALDLMDLQSTDCVLDLFCGLGNFSLPIAKRAAKVIGIEGSAEMVARAAMNAAANHITNAEFHCTDLDQPNSLTKIVTDKIDKLLIDPPRSGASQIIEQMQQLNPKMIVYVSCNPITLARDSERLVNQFNYRLQAAGVMDMFPQTAHVESIALFIKG